VDMNGNGVRDTRDTITVAWQRRGQQGKKSGTLGPSEKIDKAKYVSCVARAASDLFDQRLLSESAMLYYIEQALRFGMVAPTPTNSSTRN
jgi:hypothetical protein